MQPSDFLDFLFLFDQAKRKERIKAKMIVFKSAMQSRQNLNPLHPNY
jgi:hypothetical protein